MKKYQFKNNQGFTLIELAISSAILAVIFGGITLFGVQMIRNYQRTQVLKNSIENASYAVESLSKSIRTSHKINDGGDEIFIIDNNANKSYCYKFEGNKLKIKVGTTTATNCAGIISALTEIVGDSDIVVTGAFQVMETDRDASKRGFVRTTIILKYAAGSRDNFSDDEVMIQSSVSLRDYGFDLAP